MQSSTLADFVQGVCLDMCPLSERVLRQRERLLHPLEIKLGSEKNLRPEADPFKTVKEYSRSAAGHAAQKACDLRPLPVLISTTLYLLRVSIDNIKAPNWNVVYDFVADRLRAVRKDMVVQGLHGPEVLAVLEPMVLFHVYAGYKLCDCKPSMFDPKLNNDLLIDCFRRILDIYDSGCESKYRGLIESIFALHSIQSNEGLERLISLPPDCRGNDSDMATKISFAFCMGNYARVCHLFKKLPALLACIMSQHLPSLRRNSLLIMSSAYSSKILKVPASHLASLLLFESSKDVLKEATHYGIPCEEDQVQFQRGKFNLATKVIAHSRLPHLDIEFQAEDFISTYLQGVNYDLVGLK